jgi:HK97 family phage major capsid protein
MINETSSRGGGVSGTLETKRLGDGDIAAAFDDFMRAFAAFKETNDERLGEIERRMSSDVVTTDKLMRIDQALDAHKRAVDELAFKASRPILGGDPLRSGVSLQHKVAFDGYMRKGEAGQLRDIEAKALSVGSDPDGGYLVPDETETTINGALRDISPIRAIAGVRQVSGSVYKKPFAISGAATGWVGEAAARPETNSPTLAELAFPTMELYAMPSATQSLLDDGAVDIDQWIADEVRAAFAEQEGTAFVIGDGVNKPRGFTTYATVDNGSWSWGNIGTVPTGVSADFAATDPADALIDLIYAVRSGYRANAHFVMNRATQSVVRKMKDGDGNYLWQPGLQPGQAPTLMGFAIAESEDMPDIAADSNAIAFGDFRRGYLIVDRVGIRVLRDPFSAKPYVLFYTTKRVGGGVQDFDAIKFLRFGV